MTEQDSRLLIETAARSEENTRRIENIESDIKQIQDDQKAIYKIATSVEVIAQRVGHIEEKVNDTNQKVDAQAKAWVETEKRLQEKVDETANKPLKRTADNVNSIKVAVITAICTALASGVVAAAIAFLSK